MQLKDKPKNDNNYCIRTPTWRGIGNVHNGLSQFLYNPDSVLSSNIALEGFTQQVKEFEPETVLNKESG